MIRIVSCFIGGERSYISLEMENFVDNIDGTILSCLIRNARISYRDIAEELRDKGIKRTSRAISMRIQRLEREGRISGYTLQVGPKSFENRIIRLILISFKTTSTFSENITMFTNYLQNAPFVAIAARIRGEYDWFNVKAFPNVKIANQESDMFRTLFGDIIDRYIAYDVSFVKFPNYIRAVNYSIEEFYEFCKKWVMKNNVYEVSTL